MNHIFFLALASIPHLAAPLPAPAAIQMSNMVPQFKIPLSKFIVPTLEELSEILAIKLRRDIYDYASDYSRILMKHFTSETEIQIVSGEITTEFEALLHQLETEMDQLQYHHQLCSLLRPWRKRLTGQPVYHNYLHEIITNLFNDFEKFIYKLQTLVTEKMRAGNQKLCQKACNMKSKILKLMEEQIPERLARILKNGANSVLSDKLNLNDFEKDLILAAINYFRDENLVYPLINQTLGLIVVLKQLISQTPTNSKQIEFYIQMRDDFLDKKPKFIEQLGFGHFIDNKEVHNILPRGTILNISDKGLGPCLLPIDWYIEQYQVQSQKKSCTC